MRTGLALLFSLLTTTLLAQTNPYSISLEPKGPERTSLRGHLPQRKQDWISESVRVAQSASLYSSAKGSGWSDQFTVPGVVDGRVLAMATDGVNLYIGGTFTVIGGTVANNVIRWDGTRWHSIGEGAENGVTGSVEALAFADGKLFVGGTISRAGSKSVNAVAYWDGSEWQSLGTGDTNGVRSIIRLPEGDPLVGKGHIWSMHAQGDMIYIGGWINLVGTDSTQGIAGWHISSQRWETFGGGLKSRFEGDLVYGMSFAVQGNSLFVGGKFDTAGSVHARNIARWDGTIWSALAEGANNWVRGLAVGENGMLFASGFFDSIGTKPVSGLAQWNGASWASVGDLSVREEGSTYFPDVREVHNINGGLYITGSFQQVNGMPASGLARWDGATWHAINGLGYTHGMWPGSVRNLQKVGEALYVGGDFKTADDLLLSDIARWHESSSTWSRLTDGNAGKGIYDGALYAIASYGNATYAGGLFTAPGGVYARNIAKWKDGEWDHLSMGFINGIKGSVSAIVADGENVYVGGSFGFAGSVQAYHIAQWNGKEWFSIGIGVGGVSGASVDALLKVGNYLYVGGHFAVVGDEENYALPANSIARFNLVTRRWESLGYGIEYVEGFPGFVDALEYDGMTIYAGGLFSRADEREAWSVAAWDGKAWIPVGPKKANGVDGRVSAIKSADDKLILGGIFSVPGHEEIRSLASWDGVSWSSIGGGISNDDQSTRVSALYQYQNKLIVGGFFGNAGDKKVSGLAMWDGMGWSDLGGGTNGTVLGLTVANNKLMVGGWFTTAGGMPSIAIAQFDLLTTPVEHEETGAPVDFVVYQNYPNPFNPATNVRFQLDAERWVRISVFNVLGEKVAQLLDESRTAGTHAITWNASRHPSGTYFGRVEVAGNEGGFVQRSKIFKMMIVK